MSTFHLFSLLPAEIRCAIYILATPPRVVHVHQEVESFDDFAERLPSISIAERHIRPDIDYFAVHELLRHAEAMLRRKRRRFLKQSKLEEYGFTSDKKAPFSWDFESIVPFDALMQYPTLAFPLYRRTTMTCQAAIPPLLHTCSESRTFLVAYGYQPAFPSTGLEPLTWFNFKRDILMLNGDFEDIGASPYPSEDTETGSVFHIFHQLRPQDVRQLRQLALPIPIFYKCIYITQRMCPELKELILVEWEASDSEQALRQTIVDPTLLRPSPAIQQAYPTGEQLCLIPIEEADALWSTMEVDVFGIPESWYSEPRGIAWDMKKHKLTHGFHRSFLEDKLCQMRTEFWEEREGIQRFLQGLGPPDPRFSSRMELLSQWSIQQMSFAHVCTPYTAQRIIENRSKFMEQFTKLREETLQEGYWNGSLWNKQNRMPHPFVHHNITCNWPIVSESLHSKELEWWLTNGSPHLIADYGCN